MSYYGWTGCPIIVKTQIQRFLSIAQSALSDNLVGVYLHGSLAMGCFNPELSDIDILVAMRESISVETKRNIIQELLYLSRVPNPIEVSFLSRDNLKPWRYPTPYDLHYSELWREKYNSQLLNDEWKDWNKRTNKDPDLAAHITIVLHRGICLYGSPVETVFPNVPSEHYQASILLDYEDARKRIIENPIYGVLNLCRVYWYLLENCICSKEEAGVWAVNFLPEEFRVLVTQILEVYQGSNKQEQFSNMILKRFASYIDREIRRLINKEGAAIR